MFVFAFACVRPARECHLNYLLMTISNHIVEWSDTIIVGLKSCAFAKLARRALNPHTLQASLDVFNPRPAVN